MFLFITGIKCAGVSKLVKRDVDILHLLMGYSLDQINVIELFDLKKKLNTKKKRRETNKYIVEFYNMTKLKIDVNMGLSKLSYAFVEYMLNTYKNDKSKVFVIVGSSELYNQDKPFWNMINRRDVAVDILFGAENGDMREICTKRYHEMKNLEEFNIKLKEQIDKYYDNFVKAMELIKESNIPFNIYPVDSEIFDEYNEINKIK